MVVRGDLAKESLAVHGIPLTAWRAADLAAMGISGTAGDHFIDEATNVLILKGNTPSSSTVTDISWTQVVLPPEYVPGGAVRFVVSCEVDAAADTNTIDIIIFEANRTTGAVSTDLVTTAAQTTTATETEYTFVVTSANLEPGSILNLKMTSVNQDADGSDGIISIFATSLLLDVRG